MKISTEIFEAATRIGIGEERTIEYVAKAGFDAWDFSMFSMCDYDWGRSCLKESKHPLAGNNYLTFARKLKQIGLDNGIVCNQSHAPCPTYCKEVVPYFYRAIECTAEAGGKICVIHPDNYKTAEENAEMYLTMLPFAKACGVKIATENMWDWDKEAGHAIPSACSNPADFMKHLKAVNDDYFVACVDIGHAQMQGLNTSAVEMIRALGNKVQALHIHDNDLIHDSHQLPGTMKIDFAEIVCALKEICYDGYFTLESNEYLRGNKYTAENILDGIKSMAETARKFAEMYEK